MHKNNDVRNVAIVTIAAMSFVILIRVAAVAISIWFAIHGQPLNAISAILISEFLGWVVRQIGDVNNKLTED